jgi:polyhydroxyalkanoate synthesis regulator phasin
VVNPLKVNEWLLKLRIQNAVLHIEQDIIAAIQDHVGKLIIGLVKNGKLKYNEAKFFKKIY